MYIYIYTYMYVCRCMRICYSGQYSLLALWMMINVWSRPINKRLSETFICAMCGNSPRMISLSRMCRVTLYSTGPFVFSPISWHG